eukprot:TRINITY_DN29351_c0_g1_i1.p1 TRINITY_DN29351_c0_g1~~TRINITY_DN29351_c0_g1_i1.p1  ORF type:complete len:186 (+),score=77.61 TRINITY_DN29351_c0_g1_i1:75-632(+)
MLGGKLRLKGDKAKRTAAAAAGGSKPGAAAAAGAAAGGGDRARILSELARLESDAALPPDARRERAAELRAQLHADREVRIGFKRDDDGPFPALPPGVRKRLEELREDEQREVGELKEEDLRQHKRLRRQLEQGRDVDPISIYGDIKGGRRAGAKGGADDPSDYEKQLDRRCQLKHDRWCGGSLA